MNRLTMAQVLRLHSALIDRFGGQHGIHDPGLLESALERPFAEFAGTEAYPSLPGKTAALMYGLANNHPFIDGNKRVALAATLVFLELNGVALTLSRQRAVRLTEGVASGVIDQDRLAELFAGLLGA